MKNLQITAYRDFGKIIEDSLKFFFYNWKKILTFYLIFAMPFYIISILLFNFWFSNLEEFYEVGEANLEFSLGALFAGVAGFLSFLAFSLAFYAYTAWRADEEQKEFPDYENWWSGTLERMKLQAWSFIGVILLFAVAVGLLMGTAIFLTVFNLFLGGLIFLVLFFVLIYYSVAFSYVQFSAVESTVRSFWDHFRYGFNLVKGYWWETLGLLIVMGLIRMILTLILSIPFMAYTLIQNFGTSSFEAVDTFNNMAYTWASSAFGSLFYVIVITAIVFKYYSIIEEKEGVSLKKRIDAFGEEGRDDKFENEGDF
jgi:hypothetical protein